MNKKNLIILSTAALIALAAASWYFSGKNTGKSEADLAAKDQAKILEAVANPVNGLVVGENMPETNPFAVGVSPYDAYKNPFKK